MTDTPSLFDPQPDNRAKRPTRYRLEVCDHMGRVVWDMLVTEQPPAPVLLALNVRNLNVRRPTVKGDPDRHLVYSRLDPQASITAAHEAHARRATKRSAVLMLLLRHCGGWVARDEVRAVGGDSGDRRVRELRQDGWPIEISQTREGMAWACRLMVPGAD